jgi:outer membrane beta-barrel protein
MKAALIFSAIFTVFVGLQANAQDDGGDSSAEKAPKKVDMKNIEAKYWQPSDQSYSVVQSRTFAKEKKFGVSLMAGTILADDYATGLNFDIALSYHFTERWGVEVQYSSYALDDNDVTENIFGLNGSPDFGRVQSFYGVMARWVPFYSKMSFMGTKVVYFDMSIGLGVGMISYDQFVENGGTTGPGGTRDKEVAETVNAPSIAFDISQTFFINPKFAIRADYKMRFFNEEILAFNDKVGDVDRGDKLRDEFSNISSLNLGITYYF